MHAGMKELYLRRGWLDRMSILSIGALELTYALHEWTTEIERSAHGRRVVLNLRRTATIRVENRPEETAGPINVKPRHGNRTVDVAVATTISIDRATAKDQD